jgi:hypothetical protein
MGGRESIGAMPVSEVNRVAGVVNRGRASPSSQTSCAPVQAAPPE